MEPNLLERLQSDLKTAMKAHDNISRDVIRFTISSIKYAAIEKGSDLDAAESAAILQRDVKRRLESIEQFQAGNRDDLVARETEQLAVLQHYLPPQLTESELEAIVTVAIAQSGATSVKEMGKVMPLAIKAVDGRADGKRISDNVKRLLGNS